MPQGDVTTAYPVAFVGMEPDSSVGNDNYISRVSAETVKQIPFGHMVMQGVTDAACLQMTSQTGVPLGIVPYSATYQIANELANVADSDGNLGLKPGVDIQIKRRGRLWVKIDENVTFTDAVKVRTSVVSTVGPGSFRKTALATHTIDLSKVARWCGTYTAADGFGLLEFDLTGVYGLMSADS